ncbi:DUF7793 family protein [Arthrobacter sp. TmT3-37]
MSTFDDDFRVTKIDRCAVSVCLQRPLSITEADAVAILQRSFEVTDHRKYVVLVDMALISDVSPAARRVFCSARNILAAAMLGHGPMDRMLSAPYEHAVYPSEYFTDQETAQQWLSLMHDLVCTDPVEHTMSLTIDLDPFRPRPRHTPQLNSSTQTGPLMIGRP